MYNLTGTRIANDASFDGSVVVGSQSFGYANGEAFRASNDGLIQYLGYLPGHHGSAAQAVSPDGKTVVGFSSGPDWAQPFRWTEVEGMTSLGALPDDTRQIGKALDVSADGQTVVGMASSVNGVFEAFRWTAATGMQPLGDLPGGLFESTAYDVSDDGRVVVGFGSSTRFRISEAFIWQAETGMQSLTEVLIFQYWNRAWQLPFDGSNERFSEWSHYCRMGSGARGRQRGSNCLASRPRPNT